MKDGMGQEMRSFEKRCQVGCMCCGDGSERGNGAKRSRMEALSMMEI